MPSVTALALWCASVAAGTGVAAGGPQDGRHLRGDQARLGGGNQAWGRGEGAQGAGSRAVVFRDATSAGTSAEAGLGSPVPPAARAPPWSWALLRAGSCPGLLASPLPLGSLDCTFTWCGRESKVSGPLPHFPGFCLSMHSAHPPLDMQMYGTHQCPGMRNSRWVMDVLLLMWRGETERLTVPWCWRHTQETLYQDIAVWILLISISIARRIWLLAHEPYQEYYIFKN